MELKDQVKQLRRQVEDLAEAVEANSRTNTLLSDMVVDIKCGVADLAYKEMECAVNNIRVVCQPCRMDNTRAVDAVKTANILLADSKACIIEDGNGVYSILYTPPKHFSGCLEE